MERRWLSCRSRPLSNFRPDTANTLTLCPRLRVNMTLQGSLYSLPQLQPTRCPRRS
jgi:hypothetical protein